MKNKEKVSVIIPCYNYAPYLSQTFYSLEKQDLNQAEIEIILVDDGSTDNTRNIVRHNYPQVKYIYQKNQGPAAARNTGIDAAKGDYILFLDSDDFIATNVIQTQINTLKNNEKYDISLCQSTIFVDEKNNSYKFMIRPLYKDYFNIHLCHSNIAPPSAFLYRKNVLEKCRFNSDDICLEDYIFNINCILNGFSICSNTSCTIFYRRHESIMSKVVKKYTLIIRVYELIDKYIESVYEHNIQDSFPYFLAYISTLVNKISSIHKDNEMEKIKLILEKITENMILSYNKFIFKNEGMLKSIIEYYTLRLYISCIKSKNISDNLLSKIKNFIVINFSDISKLSLIDAEHQSKAAFQRITFRSYDLSPAIQRSLPSFEDIVSQKLLI